MFRVANVVMVVALLITAAVVYQLKYASTAEAERLATLRTAIRKERDQIAIMRAEWARRTSPPYVQGLVKRHLDLKPFEVEAFSSLDDLPEKPQAAPDGIGGMLEALVDAPLTTSSISKPSASAGVPGASALRPANQAASPAAPPKPRPAPSVSAAPRAPSPNAAYQPAPPPYAPPVTSSNDSLSPLLPPAAVPGGLH